MVGAGFLDSAAAGLSPPTDQPQSKDELLCDSDLLVLRYEAPHATPTLTVTVTQTTQALLGCSHKLTQSQLCQRGILQSKINGLAWFVES